MQNTQGVEISSLSDIGRARSENQDSILVDPEHGLFILADGAGGGQGGGTASRLTVDNMAAALKPAHRKLPRFPFWNSKSRIPRLTRFLCDAAQAANQAVWDRAAAVPDLAGMASTLVAGVIDVHRCISITAGDSRIYRFHDSRLEQISLDHSLSRSLIDQGFFSEGDSGAAKYRNVLTHAVGMQDNIEVSTYDFPVEDNDLILVCSDGLTNMVSDENIASILSTAGPLEDKVEALVRNANEAGGLDNISVVLARRNNPASFWSRLLG